ncbi:MAG: calcineurin-like phosphoesterase family protein [Tannerella sp.]|jgi:hypothetical protein|nr:calcineurin-like phosphoesterase family protein [Tannerella sp.]
MIKNQKFANQTMKLLSAGMTVVLFIFFLSCGSGDDPDPVTDDFNITGVSIPSEINAVAGGNISITGKGFRMDDKISLKLSGNANKTYLVDVTAVTEQSVTIKLPQELETGRYELSVTRAGKTLVLGTSTLNISVNVDIPDREGMTVKGVVYSSGKGVPDVVVSDGYLVTKTDRDGVYYLASEKKSGFVFISVPGNYEVNNTLNAPQFFQRIGGSTVEQKNFSLTSVNNEKYVLMAMTDLHLANRNDDLSQFEDFLTDVNALINSYKASGTKVYGIMLGDLTWDLYWYERSFALPEYIPWMNKVNCSVFNIMGNHDNDPYRTGDLAGEQAYKTVIGPSYYSFNLGKVHYVVLDDIEWINTGGAQGVVGDRNFTDAVSANQIEWLKKDLAMIADKSTPIVVALHVPLYGRPNVNNSVTVNLVRGQELIGCFTGFSNVNLLSGHTHINYTVPASASLMEHNIAAVCATWWWTGRSGYADNHICRDGSPGGYGVYEFDNTAIKWYYKGTGHDKNYQFRTYDLNTVHITAAKYAPNANATYAAKLPGFAGVYANANSGNEVLINVWGYEPQWKIEVRENSVPLSVTRMSGLDPLHIISYEAKRLNVNADPTSSFVTNTTTNLFKVTASSPNSTLEIKVTDRFGNVYSENMIRPKEFTYSMK